MTTQSDFTYKTTKVQIKNTVFSVSRCNLKGRFHYYSVRKETANPFATVGKIFKSEEELLDNYRSVNMKVAMIQALDIVNA